MLNKDDILCSFFVINKVSLCLSHNNKFDKIITHIKSSETPACELTILDISIDSLCIYANLRYRKYRI
jgi:hypothetical protein